MTSHPLIYTPMKWVSLGPCFPPPPSLPSPPLFRLCQAITPTTPPPSLNSSSNPFPHHRYLQQCSRGFEARLVDVIASLALAAAPDPAKMIADAAAAAGAASNSSSVARGDDGKGRDTGTARDRARAARARSHAESALLDFVKDLVGSFLADSFGLASFAKVLKVFVRTGFPAATRWETIGKD